MSHFILNMQAQLIIEWDCLNASPYYANVLDRQFPKDNVGVRRQRGFSENDDVDTLRRMHDRLLENTYRLSALVRRVHDYSLASYQFSMTSVRSSSFG